MLSSPACTCRANDQAERDVRGADILAKAALEIDEFAPATAAEQIITPEFEQWIRATAAAIAECDRVSVLWADASGDFQADAPPKLNKLLRSVTVCAPSHFPLRLLPAVALALPLFLSQELERERNRVYTHSALTLKRHGWCR